LFTLINITLLLTTIGSGMGSQLGAARLPCGMGRSRALPATFFGAIEPKNSIPRNNILLVGVIALAGALTLSFERGAELLNFGALLAFMGVNAAALRHYYIRAPEKRLWNLISPLLGFFICLLLWLALSWHAKLLGGVWMLVGIVYGAYHTRGFREELVIYDVPAEGD